MDNSHLKKSLGRKLSTVIVRPRLEFRHFPKPVYFIWTDSFCRTQKETSIQPVPFYGRSHYLFSHNFCALYFCLRSPPALSPHSNLGWNRQIKRLWHAGAITYDAFASKQMSRCSSRKVTSQRCRDNHSAKCQTCVWGRWKGVRAGSHISHINWTLNRHPLGQPN